jgi:hypothetical protein
MEKDIGKIKKNEITDIVVRIDDFGGKTGLTIREFTTSDKYTGFTKSGTRIPAESIAEFKQMINSLNEADFPTTIPPEPPQDQPTDSISQKTEESNPEEIKEEIL